jgi:hypothetical protein
MRQWVGEVCADAEKWKDRSEDGPVSAKKPRKVKRRQREKDGDGAGRGDGAVEGEDGGVDGEHANGVASGTG